MPALPEYAKAQSYALCSQCGELFTSYKCFDMHQTEHYVIGERGTVTCHDPVERGLVWNPHRGAWSTTVEPPKGRFAPVGGPQMDQERFSAVG